MLRCVCRAVLIYHADIIANHISGNILSVAHLQHSSGKATQQVWGQETVYKFQEQIQTFKKQVPLWPW